MKVDAPNYNHKLLSNLFLKTAEHLNLLDFILYVCVFIFHVPITVF